VIFGRSESFVALVFALLGCGCATSPTDTARENVDASAPLIFVEAQTSTNAQTPRSLAQAVFDFNVGAYVFGHQDGIARVGISKAPADADPTRMAMLHDGAVYRLYMFRAGSDDTLYQFGFNAATQSYEFGYLSIPQLTLTGTPLDASTESFAMLHDGARYRLYLRSKTRETLLYQFAFNPTTQRYEHGYDSIPALELTGSPRDADHHRWAMLHDGDEYRYYARVRGSSSELYQFAFNELTGRYEFGFNSIPVLSLIGVPAGESADFAMLHDGARYRLYTPN
jgi:hemin uptake protein HemP